MSIETGHTQILPFQTGMMLQTDRYAEHRKTYSGLDLLYYQFTMGKDSGGLPIHPDGCIDLLFDCSPAHAAGRICGSILKAETVAFRACTEYFGVRLPIGASISFHRIPFRDTLNRQLLLSDLVRDGSFIGETIGGAAGFGQRIDLFERHLLPKLLQEAHPPSLIRLCVDHILDSGGRLPMEELACEIGYSSRYIRKAFEGYMGLSPKLFSRIIRFQTTLSQLMTQGARDAEGACLGAYYDQSHFVKEFKEFAMTTPARFMESLRSRHGIYAAAQQETGAF